MEGETFEGGEEEPLEDDPAVEEGERGKEAEGGGKALGCEDQQASKQSSGAHPAEAEKQANDTKNDPTSRDCKGGGACLDTQVISR